MSAVLLFLFRFFFVVVFSSRTRISFSVATSELLSSKSVLFSCGGVFEYFETLIRRHARVNRPGAVREEALLFF